MLCKWVLRNLFATYCQVSCWHILPILSEEEFNLNYISLPQAVPFAPRSCCSLSSSPHAQSNACVWGSNLPWSLLTLLLLCISVAVCVCRELHTPPAQSIYICHSVLIRARFIIKAQHPPAEESLVRLESMLTVMAAVDWLSVYSLERI